MESFSLKKYILFFSAAIILMTIAYFDNQTEKDERPEKQEKTEYKEVMTSLFWVGEDPTEENGYIDNYASAWNSFWTEDFGGLDDPNDRCGYHPCEFTPNENPFYFALPYGDFNKNGDPKPSVVNIPWYEPTKEYETILKNRWIEMVFEDNVCYAQWEDVGPFESDDFEYVFGDAEPKNTLGVAAGLDVSPAVWTCLGMETNGQVKWRFVEDHEVPDGPWKEIVTTTGVRHWRPEE